MIRAPQRDVTQALDAVRLTQHGPDPLVERQRLRVTPTGLRVIRAPQRDVPQALDAGRLEHVVADFASDAFRPH